MLQGLNQAWNAKWDVVDLLGVFEMGGKKSMFWTAGGTWKVVEVNELPDLKIHPCAPVISSNPEPISAALLRDKASTV